MASADDMARALEARLASVEEAVQGLTNTTQRQQTALELLRTMSDALQGQHTVLEESHRRYHQQVQSLNAKVLQLEEELERVGRRAPADMGEGNRSWHLVEAKFLHPGQLGNDYKDTWRSWVVRAKKYLGRVDRSGMNRLVPS